MTRGAFPSARRWLHETIAGLARESATSVGTTRLAFSREFDRARDLVLAPFLDDPSTDVLFDAADNTFVRYGPGHPGDAPLGLLVGSHLDSVRSGGGLDGVLGVVVGAALLRALCDAGLAPRRPIGLAIFSDEEGVRFGNGTFGSRALVGDVDPAELSLVEPGTGKRLADYLAGLTVRGRRGFRDGDPTAVRLPWPVHAFLEPHIEQGPRLERAGVRVGVVTAIVGIRRSRVTAEGEANHAGTTAMADRMDALLPLARIATGLPALVQDLFPAVITAGELRLEPNAMNVVPGRGALGVEWRAADETVLEEIGARVEKLVAETQKATRASLSLQPVHASRPVPMDQGIRAAITRAATALGETTMDLGSLAIHDAMHLARVCPVGMFFVPSLKGLSHTPLESSRPEDVSLALDLLARTAAELALIPAEAIQQRPPP